METRRSKRGTKEKVEVEHGVENNEVSTTKKIKKEKNVLKKRIKLESPVVEFDNNSDS